MYYFDQIKNAVYDSSIKIPPGSVNRGLTEMGLSLPLMILAAKSPSQKKKAVCGMHRQKYFWHLHSGLIYVLWKPSDSDKDEGKVRNWLCGDSQLCVKPHLFISCLQNAILSFRREEIKSIVQSKPLVLSFGEELDMRRLALSRIQESVAGKSTFDAPIWQSALEVWLDIIILRHQNHLNTLHRKLDEFLSLMSCDIDGENSLSNAFNRLQRELHHIYSLSELRQKFPLVISEMLQEFPMLQNGKYTELSAISQQALEWIEQRFASPVSLAQCAESIPVSAAYLCRIMRKETGFTPVQHLQIKRIAHAKVLLQKSRLNVNDIARHSGFRSLEHFYRVFLKHTNLTPSAYRRNVRKN
jgi:AraC-like DNA-binding protein